MSHCAALALATALLAPAPAAAWWWPLGPAYGHPLKPIVALEGEGHFAAVLDALSPAFLQNLRPNDLRDAYLMRGESFEALNRPDAALGEYQLGVSLFPKSVALLVHEASLLHRDELDEHALVLFQRALVYDRKNWRAHLGLAEIDRRLGFLDRAVTQYSLALEEDPYDAGVWRDDAEVLLARREPEAAEYALGRALDIDPKSSDAHVLLAFARRAQDDLPGALAELDAAARLGAGVGVLRAKTLWLIEAGRPADAAVEARVLLAKAPGDPAGLWALARAALPSSPSRAAEILAPLASADPEAPFSARAAAALRKAALRPDRVAAKTSP